MQSSATETTRQETNKQAMIGAGIGGVILVILLIFAILTARNEASVLGWIIAGLILAWLGVAIYLAYLVNRQAKAAQRNFELAATAARDEQNSMLDDKLSHSFQIVLVQSKVIADERANPSADAEGMIDRALDTINTTAQNGMGMIKEAKKGH